MIEYNKSFPRFWNKSNVGVIYTFLSFSANFSKDAFQSTTMFEDPFKSSTSSKGLYKPSQKSDYLYLIYEFLL